MAKILYEYYFVQFDFPDKNGKPYKSSGGEMVYNEKLKREIPNGWEVVKIGSVCDIYQPKTISEKDLVKDGKFFVYGANGIIGTYNKFNHKESEIAVTCRGASCGNVIKTLPYSWITGNAMVFKPISFIRKEYLYFFLKNKSILEKVITGSAQPQITRTNAEKLFIVIPSKGIHQLYYQQTKGIFEMLIQNQLQIQKLESLRDFLLPMLLNGQVIVNEK